MAGKKSKNHDAALLLRLKDGEPGAVQEWFRKYSDRLLRSVMTRVSVKKDAEEIVQETFLNCLKHLPLFRGESSIWTWMNTIARHEIADYYRKKYAKRTLETFPLHEKLALNEVRSSHEVSEQVKQVLCQMRTNYQELLLMKYVDDMKVADIAHRLGRTIKSVESDLYRAREEFRALWNAANGPSYGQ